MSFLSDRRRTLNLLFLYKANGGYNIRDVKKGFEVEGVQVDLISVMSDVPNGSYSTGFTVDASENIVGQCFM